MILSKTFIKHTALIMAFMVLMMDVAWAFDRDSLINRYGEENTNPYKWLQVKKKDLPNDPDPRNHTYVPGYNHAFVDNPQDAVAAMCKGLETLSEEEKAKAGCFDFLETKLTNLAATMKGPDTSFECKKKRTIELPNEFVCSDGANRDHVYRSLSDCKNECVTDYACGITDSSASECIKVAPAINASGQNVDQLFYCPLNDKKYNLENSCVKQCTGYKCSQPTQVICTRGTGTVFDKAEGHNQVEDCTNSKHCGGAFKDSCRLFSGIFADFDQCRENCRESFECRASDSISIEDIPECSDGVETPKCQFKSGGKTYIEYVESSCPKDPTYDGRCVATDMNLIKNRPADIKVDVDRPWWEKTVSVKCPGAFDIDQFIKDNSLAMPVCEYKKECVDSDIKGQGEVYGTCEVSLDTSKPGCSKGSVDPDCYNNQCISMFDGIKKGYCEVKFYTERNNLKMPGSPDVLFNASGRASTQTMVIATQVGLYIYRCGGEGLKERTKKDCKEQKEVLVCPGISTCPDGKMVQCRIGQKKADCQDGSQVDCRDQRIESSQATCPDGSTVTCAAADRMAVCPGGAYVSCAEKGKVCSTYKKCVKERESVTESVYMPKVCSAKRPFTTGQAPKGKASSFENTPSCIRGGDTRGNAQEFEFELIMGMFGENSRCFYAASDGSKIETTPHHGRCSSFLLNDSQLLTYLSNVYFRDDPSKVVSRIVTKPETAELKFSLKDNTWFKSGTASYDRVKITATVEEVLENFRCYGDGAEGCDAAATEGCRVLPHSDRQELECDSYDFDIASMKKLCNSYRVVMECPQSMTTTACDEFEENVLCNDIILPIGMSDIKTESMDFTKSFQYAAALSEAADSLKKIWSGTVEQCEAGEWNDFGKALGQFLIQQIASYVLSQAMSFMNEKVLGPMSAAVGKSASQALGCAQVAVNQVVSKFGRGYTQTYVSDLKPGENGTVFQGQEGPTGESLGAEVTMNVYYDAKTPDLSLITIAEKLPNGTTNVEAVDMSGFNKCLQVVGMKLDSVAEQAQGAAQLPAGAFQNIFKLLANPLARFVIAAVIFLVTYKSIKCSTCGMYLDEGTNKWRKLTEDERDMNEKCARDNNQYEAFIMQSNGLCHMLVQNDYPCVEKGSIFSGEDCLRTLYRSCCYDSLFARIVVEQSYEQLKEGWWNGEEPRCNGVSLADLQKLDFGKMNFSEFTDSFADKVNQELKSKLTFDIEKSVRNDIKDSIPNSIATPQ